MLQFLTRLSVLIVATGLSLPAQQTVWFTPLQYAVQPVGTFGATDYLNLFTPTAAWPNAVSQVQVFKIYGVSNFTDSQLSTIITYLQQHNIALALEWPVLPSTTCGVGIEGFGGSFLSIVQRIQAQGGTLTYLAMQQPYEWGSLYSGTNACQWTAQQVATNALIAVNQAKTIFPNLLVGDISAIPSFPNITNWPTLYGNWMDTWRSVSGAPLAFFHLDVDWTQPNWQAAIAQIRPVVEQRGIPFGIVYNGFLTDQSDTAWMTDAENHIVQYEVTSGYAPPEQVNFQTWNPNPTHVLPETDPTAFTYLIDYYARTRTQLTVANNGTQASGKLTAGGAGVAGANIQVTAQASSGTGAITTYTLTGPVPSTAVSALVGARVNTECYACNGPSDLTIYSFQYSDTQVSPNTWNFLNGLNNWQLSGTGASFFDFGAPPYTEGLHLSAAAGQTLSLNSTAIGVTSGSQFTLQVTARVSPQSIGTGYFTVIWFDAQGNEPSRQIIYFEPQTLTVGTATTAADGSYSVPTSLSPGSYQLTANYAGSSTQWVATASTSSAPPTPPTAVSLAPLAGGGSATTFTAVFSDPNGFANIANAQVLINSSTSSAAGCSISYLPATASFQLFNDAGTVPSSTVLSNSQCTLSGATASGSGNTLTLTLPLTFNSAFGALSPQKSVYLQATDSQGLTTSWQTMGAWSPVTTGACALTVSPTSAAVGGAGGVFTLNLSGGSCGWTATPNSTWLTAVAPSGTGGLNVTAAANTTGAQRTGTITLGGQTVTVTQAANNALQIPSLVSLNPYQGQGSPANLTLVYAHPNGWAAIKSAQFIMNPNWEAGSTNGGCLVQYAPGNEQWTLIADDGISVAGTATLGAATTLSNSQCSLNVGSSSVVGSGTTLTVAASLTFTPSFTGQRHIWMEASDYNNLSTNWLVYGVWFPVAQTMVAEPWWQIYDPFTKNWLYSGDPNEYATLGTEGFTQQGELGQVMNVPGTVGGLSNIIWYRAFVNSTSSHFWTSDRNEFLTIINQQSAYVGEGVAAFVMPYINAQGQVSPQVTNTIPFWRGVFTGSNLHYWTVQTGAFNAATGYGEWPAGYIGEGIACYIFPVGTAQFSSEPATPVADALYEQKDDGSPAVVSVSNGASYARTGVIAPGQVLNIHGRRLGGAVLLNGVPAQVISSAENQMRVVAPQNLSGTTEVTLEVESQGRRTKPITLRAVQADPAIFGSNVFGKGNAQAMNEDGTANEAQHAARRGSVVTLYTTGYSAANLPLEVHIGGYPAQIVSTHVSATRAGVIELQVRVPEGVAPAAFQPVVLRVGNLFSQPGVGLAIQ